MYPAVNPSLNGHRKRIMRLNMAIGTWEVVGTLPVGLAFHSSVVRGGSVFLYGGSSDDANYDPTRMMFKWSPSEPNIIENVTVSFSSDRVFSTKIGLIDTKESDLVPLFAEGEMTRAQFSPRIYNEIMSQSRASWSTRAKRVCKCPTLS